MTRLVVFVLWIVVAACGKPSEKSGEVKSLNADEFNDKIKGDVVLIDVRTPAEFTESRIEGATNLNLQDPSFEKWLDSLDQTKEYALYCAGGGRSSRAASLMKDKGFRQVNDLNGGLKAWKEKGLPVVPR